MAFIKTTERQGKSIYEREKVVEVFIKGVELIKVLHQQDIYASSITLDEQYCLTFKHSELEKYD